MEKAMTVEERIRRAEDRYNRKNGQYARKEIREKTNNKKKSKVVRKMIMQIIVCLLIYIVFYAVTNKEYIFSEEFRNEVNETIEKLKINEAYANVKAYIENNILKKDEQEQKQEDNTENQENKEETTETTDEKSQETETDMTQDESSENIGGAEEEQNAEDNSGDEELDETAQMQKDAEDIKSSISFINPITGTITSTFGWRNPTTSTVPKYHTGLDIAATEGTVIKSATDGKIVLVSSDGDYGNHYKIQVDDVIIIYAHCKTLYLKEGDTVKQGQEIAEVGSTGNSTGPHLHFEVRKSERLVDPQLILDI